MRFDYNEELESAEPLELTLSNGQTVSGMLFNARLDLNTIPEGKYLYQIRHSDDDAAFPCTIETLVCVNHYGDFVTDTQVNLKKLKSEKSEWEFLEIEDWNYLD